jgi:hypothetical protein
MLGPLSTVLLRLPAPAYQAECRGFETRLPLHFPFRAQHDTQPVILLPELAAVGLLQRSAGQSAIPRASCQDAAALVESAMGTSTHRPRPTRARPGPVALTTALATCLR